jgi:hypothetical protein
MGSAIKTTYTIDPAAVIPRPPAGVTLPFFRDGEASLSGEIAIDRLVKMGFTIVPGKERQGLVTVQKEYPSG